MQWNLLHVEDATVQIPETGYTSFFFLHLKHKVITIVDSTMIILIGVIISLGKTLVTVALEAHYILLFSQKGNILQSENII